MLSINVDDVGMKILADVFGCMMGNFPFTYLGLPLGTTRPGIHNLTPFGHQSGKKNNCKLNFLGLWMKITIDHLLSILYVNFFMCSLDLPPKI
jgi:hypothetical protein